MISAQALTGGEAVNERHLISIPLMTPALKLERTIDKPDQKSLLRVSGGWDPKKVTL